MLRIDGDGLALFALIGHEIMPPQVAAFDHVDLVLAAPQDDDMLEPEDEEGEDDEDAFDNKRVAIAQIHLLGFLQQMLIEEENPPPSDFEAPWNPDPED